MNQIYVISDTHFGHRGVLEFEAAYRPFRTIEEHDAELVRRWNAVVKPKDTVWHLGDVLFGRDTFAILGQLNGVKKLVMGNHDRYPSALYLEYFSTIVGAAEIDGCILTHIPVHEGATDGDDPAGLSQIGVWRRQFVARRCGAARWTAGGSWLVVAPSFGPFAVN